MPREERVEGGGIARRARRKRCSEEDPAVRGSRTVPDNDGPGTDLGLSREALVSVTQSAFPCPVLTVERNLALIAVKRGFPLGSVRARRIREAPPF